ncbi:MAG: OmpA family protein [Acidimicrobiia bacterium]|nr:OmpA family protein [Acidimicrobiia bacterium]
MTDSRVEPAGPSQEQMRFQDRYPGYDFDPTWYDPGEVDDDLKHVSRDDADERTSWSYLGVLCAVFLGLVGFAFGCEALENNETLPEVVSDETGVSVAAAPVRLNIEVEGDIVILRGAVPDEAARAQLLATVESIYNSANIIDELTVDPETVLDGGSVAITGLAGVDDERPVQLRDAVVSDFGLEDGGVTVERSEEDALIAVSIDGIVAGGSIRFSGALPDQASIDDLAAAGQAAFGSADVSGVVIDERTWTDAQLRVMGSVAPGDTNHEQLVTEIESRFGTLLPVDISAVTIDLSADALSVLEAEIQEAVTANPILFAPQSSDIDPSSDAVLAEIAQRLLELPNISVEVVGHTDDQGSDDENQMLSEDRAEAVKARLIELGIDEARIEARGEGEQFPLVPNDTPENRELNRRIEFNLISGG